MGNGSLNTTGIQQVKYGADVNAHDKFGASAPNTASDLGRLDILARFLDKGFSYNLEKLANAAHSRPDPPHPHAPPPHDNVLPNHDTRSLHITPPPHLP